ncbi:MAG: hypothetical protein M0C28_42935 [Candidatus Moduliflexus flocculans]|nr:hypothetical protein [Candidatus Moduliflexus flocculans]
MMNPGGRGPAEGLCREQHADRRHRRHGQDPRAAEAAARPKASSPQLRADDRDRSSRTPRRRAEGPGLARRRQGPASPSTTTRPCPGAEYLLVLVQNEQEHKGGNGVEHHRMVVRDLRVADPSGPKSAEFDLAVSEKAADAYLTEFEKTYTRVPNFKWEVAAQRHRPQRPQGRLLRPGEGLRQGPQRRRRRRQIIRPADFSPRLR